MESTRQKVIKFHIGFNIYYNPIQCHFPQDILRYIYSCIVLREYEVIVLFTKQTKLKIVY